MKIKSLLLGIALLLGSAAGYGQLTPKYYSLSGTITSPDGTPFTGTLSIELARPTAVNLCSNPPSIVAQSLAIYKVQNGVIVNGSQASFLSNACMTPSIPYYVQMFNTSNARVYVDNWYFPFLNVTSIDVGTLSDVGFASN